jgi:SAM-dependent methyltransferase
MCSIYPKEILDLAVDIFRPRSVLDVGCGTGISLEYFIKRKIESYGVEGSPLAIEQCRYPHFVRLHNLHQPLDLHRTFDLVWCFEVAEHIHPDFANQLVETLARHGNTLLMSAAPPGQGGCGHLNEQEPEYWDRALQKYNFSLDAETTARFHALAQDDVQFAKNVLIFLRR